ncbi:LysE family transporter [Fluviicola taffensis]|uniref:LysE family transporter n=1 Tax=Fluviicola taffensis TaxID=191579 RepID=UPI0031380AF8
MKFLERYKRAGLYGGFISLIGTLPFGVLNILAFTIGARESIQDALLFSLGVVLSEMMIVACCLKWFKLPFKKTSSVELLQYLMVGFIFFLAFQQIQQIGTPSEEKTDMLASNWPRFLLGAGLSAINPSQFPFWITWNGILKNKGLLQTTRNRNGYLIGIGIGTFCGLCCFILASQLIHDSTELVQSKNYYLSVSGIFALTGIILLVRLLYARFKTSPIRSKMH